VKLPTCDVKHRWNSTYLLIESSLEIQQQINMFVASDPDLENLRMVQAEWEHLKKVKDFLEVQYTIM